MITHRLILSVAGTLLVSSSVLAQDAVRTRVVPPGSRNPVRSSATPSSVATGGTSSTAGSNYGGQTSNVPTGGVGASSSFNLNAGQSAPTGGTTGR